MLLNRLLWSVVVAASASGGVLAQTSPVSGLYQIISGSYSACCGIAGDLRYPLPAEEQAFVKLEMNSQTNLASLSFLGQDKQTVFTVIPCPPAEPLNFHFEKSLVYSNQIVFEMAPGPPPDHRAWTYTVSNSLNGLRIDGKLSLSPGNCADFPTEFSHSNVVAVWVSNGPLLIDNVEQDKESLRFHFRGEAPFEYTVEYTDSLLKTNWIPLATYQAKLKAIDVTVTNFFTNALTRFFRVLKEPCDCR